jgi:hypothetical protein
MKNGTPRTIEQIRGTIRSARDSVWVITDEIEKLDAGGTPNKNAKGNIDRNVSHLKLIVADQEIIESDEDISDLIEAIEVGEGKLAEDIWPADEDTD